MITNLILWESLPTALWSSVLRQTEKSATVFPHICYKTAEEIIFTHTIKKCTHPERRPSGRPWRLESLLWTGVTQSGGTFTNGILLSAHGTRLFLLIFMGKGSIHWDNCSFLTHFTAISACACQCFLADSLIELEIVLVLPMIRQR